MNPYRRLLYDVLLQACRDALTGDAEAVAWLQDAGAYLAWRLGVVDDPERVRRWAVQPTAPTGLTIQHIQALSGISHGTIQTAIYHNELCAFPALLGKAYPYLIPPAEARWWLKQQGV